MQSGVAAAATQGLFVEPLQAAAFPASAEHTAGFDISVPLQFSPPTTHWVPLAFATQSNFPGLAALALCADTQEINNTEAQKRVLTHLLMPRRIAESEVSRKSRGRGDGPI